MWRSADWFWRFRTVVRRARTNRPLAGGNRRAVRSSAGSLARPGAATAPRHGLSDAAKPSGSPAELAGPARRGLEALLLATHDAAMMRRLVDGLDGGRVLLTHLPSEGVSDAELAHQVVVLLERYGLIDERLFERLEQARGWVGQAECRRPTRHLDRIRQVRRSCLGA